MKSDIRPGQGRISRLVDAAARTNGSEKEKNNNNEVFSFDGGSVTGRTGPDGNLTATKLYG
jgi:hypothetical protein